MCIKFFKEKEKSRAKEHPKSKTPIQYILAQNDKGRAKKLL